MEYKNPLSELPQGLAMALAAQPEAMNRFAALTPEQQMAVIAQVHSINSSREMQSFVSSLIPPR